MSKIMENMDKIKEDHLILFGQALQNNKPIEAARIREEIHSLLDMQLDEFMTLVSNK